MVFDLISSWDELKSAFVHIWGDEACLAVFKFLCSCGLICWATLAILYHVVYHFQQLPHKPQSLRKLPIKKNMKEQEKGEGSDGKENMKTRSDESGEEKNGDDDNQKSAQKKKGEKRLVVQLKQDGFGSSRICSRIALWQSLFLHLWFFCQDSVLTDLLVISKATTH